MFLSSFAFSQGFDWERSARMPFEIPKSYYGGSISMSQGALYGNTLLLSNGLECCRFEDGALSSFSIRAGFEYWYKSNLAFTLDAGLVFITYDLDNQRTLPYFTGEDLIVNYTLNSKNTNLRLAAGAKYRIYEKLNIGFKVNLLFNLMRNTNSVQEVESPSSFFFRNGTKRLEVENPEISNFNGLLLIPELIFSYDFQLFYPVYVSPFVSGGLSLNTLNDENLRFFEFRFGVSVFYGN